MRARMGAAAETFRLFVCRARGEAVAKVSSALDAANKQLAQATTDEGAARNTADKKIEASVLSEQIARSQADKGLKKLVDDNKGEFAQFQTDNTQKFSEVVKASATEDKELSNSIQLNSKAIDDTGKSASGLRAGAYTWRLGTSRCVRTKRARWPETHSWMCSCAHVLVCSCAR